MTLALVWDMEEIIYLYLGLWTVFIFVMPLYLIFVDFYGVNIWLDWGVRYSKIHIVYYVFIGGFIGVFFMIPSLAYIFGFKTEFVIQGAFVVLVLCLTMVYFRIVEKYARINNLGERVLLSRGRYKVVKEAVERALESLEMKSTKGWVGSRWTGYFAYRIENQPIHYNVNPGFLMSSIVIKLEIQESGSKVKEIENAINLQLGIM